MESYEEKDITACNQTIHYTDGTDNCDTIDDPTTEVAGDSIHDTCSTDAMNEQSKSIFASLTSRAQDAIIAIDKRLTDSFGDPELLPKAQAENCHTDAHATEEEVRGSNSNEEALPEPHESNQSSIFGIVKRIQAVCTVLDQSMKGVSDKVVSTSDSVVESISAVKIDPVLHKRPSWNTSFATAVKLLRVAAATAPVNIEAMKALRLITDHGNPFQLSVCVSLAVYSSMLLLIGVPAWMPTLPSNIETKTTKNPPGEWFYPKSLGFQVRVNANPKAMHDGKYILYLHGGAFCCCNPATHRGLLYRLSDQTDATIFAVDYRRPPEFPFPIPVDDCISAYLYILEKVGDSSRIILSGDSAGGNLVISTLLRIQELSLPSPAGGVLISPWVDLTDYTSSSWDSYSDIDYIKPGLAKLFAECYQGTCGTYHKTHLSPIFSDALHMLPPLLIEVGGCEVLHDQIIRFSDKVKEAGGTVTCNVREDMVHVFPIYSFTGMPQCDEAFRDIVRFVNELCSTRVSDDFYFYNADVSHDEPKKEEVDSSMDTQGGKKEEKKGKEIAKGVGINEEKSLKIAEEDA